MKLISLSHRRILRLGGDDRKTFLQGLVTNDIYKLTPTQPLYTLLLSPQGKILFDFILIEVEDEIWIDCWQAKATELLQRLLMYKLRAKVTLTLDESLHLYASHEVITGIRTAVTFKDPRHPKLGYRIVDKISPLNLSEFAEYEQLRLQLGIPESQDFINERSFPMEFGITYLNGISYTKGCYVGQEIIARNKNRDRLNKALYCVYSYEGKLPALGAPINVNGAEVGQLRSNNGQQGLAILRVEAVSNAISPATALYADSIMLEARLPDWFYLPNTAISGE